MGKDRGWLVQRMRRVRKCKYGLRRGRGGCNGAGAAYDRDAVERTAVRRSLDGGAAATAKDVVGIASLRFWRSGRALEAARV